MSQPGGTREDEEIVGEQARRLRPGVVIAFRAGEPALEAHPLGAGRTVLGRDDGDVRLGDDLVSKRHAEVRFDGRRWTIRDLGSRNGTFVDGDRITTRATATPRVLRVGHTLALLVRDLDRLDGDVEVREGMVVGPTLRAALAEVEAAANTAETLLITGESGTGKELAARTYHAAGPHAAGPFIAVNCAAIPEGVAERLLFGARRGAYSGATADVDGYLQSADGGTLFLDEVAELDLQVQAKLLRVIETREVLQLGAARPRALRFKLCVATNADLRDEATAKRFRPDLYFRVGRPEVRLPALRERLEDVPRLVSEALRRVAPELQPQARLVEVCLCRGWPGNVRELWAEVTRAAHAARSARRVVVQLEDLAPHAGLDLDGPSRPAPKHSADAVDRPSIVAALRRERGNVTAAARRLGLHRNQLRRLIEELGVSIVGEGTVGEGEEDP